MTNTRSFIRSLIPFFIGGSAIIAGSFSTYAAKTPHTVLKPSSSRSFRDVLGKITSPKCGASLEKTLADFRFDRWMWRPEPNLGGKNTFTGFAPDSFAWGFATTAANGNALITIQAGGSNASVAIDAKTCRFDAASTVSSLIVGSVKPPTDRTLYYSWSTGMLLSLEGMPEILQVAKATDSKIVFLSDAKLTSDEIKIWRSKIEPKLSTKDVRWLSLADYTNDEVAGLLARGIRLHYPSILLAEKGYIQPLSFPGHKPADAWKNWVEVSSSEISKSKGAK